VLAPSNGNILFHLFFSAIIPRTGNVKTFNVTILHDTISQHNLTYVNKAVMNTQDSKPDTIISMNSMS